MTDGYEPYHEVARANALVHLGCWAHARRYLVEAQQNLPKERRADHPVSGLITRIGRLFAVEAQAQQAAMTPEARKRLRDAHSRPVLAEIEALHYLHGQWPKLIRYLDNGAWPISNNPCENAIRPFVVGRRNWLFSDTIGGANASANLYSLIETCKANGVDAYQYLVALFGTLPSATTADDYEALLPWRLMPAPAA